MCVLRNQIQSKEKLICLFLDCTIHTSFPWLDIIRDVAEIIVSYLTKSNRIILGIEKGNIDMKEVIQHDPELMILCLENTIMIRSGASRKRKKLMKLVFRYHEYMSKT